MQGKDCQAAGESVSQTTSETSVQNDITLVAGIANLERSHRLPHVFTISISFQQPNDRPLHVQYCQIFCGGLWWLRFYFFIYSFIYDLSIYLSIYLPIFLFTYLPIYLSTYLPIYPSTYLPIDLLIYRSIDLLIYLSIYLSIHPSICYLSIYLLIHVDCVNLFCWCLLHVRRAPLHKLIKQ